MMKNSKKVKKFRSLKITLALAFLVLIVVILIVSNSLNIYFRYQTQEKIIDGQLQLSAQNAAQEVRNFLVGKIDELKQGVRFGDLASASPAEQKLVLEKLLGDDPSFRQLVLQDDQGQNLKVSRLSTYASDEFLRLVGNDSFINASKEGRYFGSVYINQLTSEPMVILSVPFNDLYGSYKGLLMAEVNLKFMWDLVGSIRVGNTGLAYVVDDQGNLIAFSDISRVLKQENLADIVEVKEFVSEDASTYQSSSRVVKGILGGESVTTHVRLNDPDWALIVELPVQEAYADFYQEMALAVMVFFLSICLAVMICVYLLNKITKPITKLRDITNQVGEGNLDVDIEPLARNEIGQLAHDFNQMVGNLKKTRNELLDSQKNLEHKVDERTKELNKSKQDLEKILELKTTAEETVRKLNESLEQKVMERTAEVQKLLKQKDEFINQLSHDLKSPLTPLVNLLPIIKNKVADEDLKSSVDACLRSSIHIKNLVFKTLQLARLNSSEFVLNKENFNLLSEVNDIIANNQFLFNLNEVNIENHVDKEISLSADRLQLKEVFDNLFSNAVKYSALENKKIIIDARTEANGNIVVSVNDNGKGMSRDQILYAFDEFYKADSSRHDLNSSGLGLSICRRIVEHHGGKIWFESPGLGKGSTVFFTIPSADKMTA
jgi:signal transduction histidine kinase